jgi:excisionase family DNA binding protein
MSPTYITLQEAAERLGVHYMTAYRYVRTGRLPASRRGVQWLVNPADLDRLAAEGAGGHRRRGTFWTEAPRTLAARLVAGDEAGSWAVLESSLASGAEPDRVMLDLLGPAMVEIGDGWEVGTLGVADEHRATAVAQRLIGRLGPRFARRGRKRGTIIVGAPAGEEHALPSAILSDLLRGARFEVHDLGADTPAESFAAAARQTDRLLAVMVGVTAPGNDRATRETLRVLRAAGVTATLIAGGAAVEDAAHADRLNADRWSGHDARTALATVEGLAPREAGPARG